jgi:cobalt-zinc-cadmium efflux system outer membrane protein
MSGAFGTWVGRKGYCLALIILWLTGCVHYRVRPLAPIQSQESFQKRGLNDPGLAQFARSSIGASEGAWPPKTLDLRSATLIATYFSPALQVARAQVKTAEAGIIAAGGRLNPSISAAGGYENSPESPLVLRFELSLPVETARKRSYRILAAAKLADVARMELKETSWRVYTQVREAWNAHLRATEEADILRAQSEIRLEAASLLEKRLALGEISQPEWNAVQVEVSRVAVAQRAAEGRAGETLAQLASAMAMPVDALERMSLNLRHDEQPQLLEDLPIARVQKKGLLNRLDVQRALLEYAATEANLQLEVARQYPDLQLNPGYDFDEGHHKFTFGPALPVPVWNRNRGGIAEADAKRAEVEARFLALQSQAIGEMEHSLAQYRTAMAEFQEADQKWSVIQATRERATIRAVQLGAEDRLALNAMQLESLTVRSARLSALAKTRTAFSALEEAVQAPLGDVPWLGFSEPGKPENP